MKWTNFLFVLFVNTIDKILAVFLVEKTVYYGPSCSTKVDRFNPFKLAEICMTSINTNTSVKFSCSTLSNDKYNEPNCAGDIVSSIAGSCNVAVSKQAQEFSCGSYPDSAVYLLDGGKNCSFDGLNISSDGYIDTDAYVLNFCYRKEHGAGTSMKLSPVSPQDFVFTLFNNTECSGGITKTQLFQLDKCVELDQGPQGIFSESIAKTATLRAFNGSTRRNGSSCVVLVLLLVALQFLF